ncbi:hypothetical protein ALC53_03070 [Atta colombica]|uniref:Uncharacterized protein n=1 Tax=Atta colombica TaxID=520822 RepID=A0A195BPZ1_9HYME|nr:hypothetical protein ALC53_03070 [Atta colombica]
MCPGLTTGDRTAQAENIGGRRCVPTQQDGSSTGRHSVFDVKLFTHLGSRAAFGSLGETCTTVSLRRCVAVPRVPSGSDVSWSRQRWK